MEKSFLYRRSFHLKFFQTGNKNFSENFHLFFCRYIYTCWITASTWGNPTNKQTPHPTLHTEGRPLPYPKPTSQHQPQPNPGSTDIATQTLTAANPSSVPILCHFLSLSLNLRDRHWQAHLPVPPRTDYTGCGFQFYIVWPFLALITLIN